MIGKWTKDCRFTGFVLACVLEGEGGGELGRRFGTLLDRHNVCGGRDSLDSRRKS